MFAFFFLNYFFPLVNSEKRAQCPWRLLCTWDTWRQQTNIQNTRRGDRKARRPQRPHCPGTSCILSAAGGGDFFLLIVWPFLWKHSMKYEIAAFNQILSGTMPSIFKWNHFFYCFHISAFCILIVWTFGRRFPCCPLALCKHF